MKKIQYQIVRYKHDSVTGEFVNVGIILFQPETGFLSSKFISKYSRITNFFTNVNGNYLVKTLKFFQKELVTKQDELHGLFNDYKSIDDITKSILSKDNSALICSEILHAIDIDPINTLNDLYNRYIEKYFHEQDKEIKDDNFAWKKVYKKYFDKYEITNKLKSHTIKTDFDNIEFEKSWKNGVWNCFETLSFDLKKTESIKNKVYKWSGILNELENSKEEINLYFLTVLPSNDKNDLTKFIEETLTKQNLKSIKVSMIKESEADKFVKSVKHKIENHCN